MTQPAWVCHDCGAKWGLRPGVDVCSTFHAGDRCGVCGRETMTTQPRDYGYLRDGWEREEPMSETTLRISARLAEQIRDWAEDEIDHVVLGTDYHADLTALMRQIAAEAARREKKEEIMRETEADPVRRLLDRQDGGLGGPATETPVHEAARCQPEYIQGVRDGLRMAAEMAEAEALAAEARRDRSMRGGEGQVTNHMEALMARKIAAACRARAGE